MRTPLFVFVGLFLFACHNSKDCGCINDAEIIIGSGSTITKTYTIESFSSISISSFTNISIETGKEQSITINGQQNILNLLQVNLADESLNVTFDNNLDIRPTEDLTALITMPEDLKNLSFVGLAEIELLGKEQNNLQLHFTGSANLNSLELPIKNMVVNWAGEGTAKIYSIDELTLNCTGVFDIGYKGEPTITNNSTGTVKVGSIS
nr:DUF2807 domain-containing protein [uncultured Carboxylicivirga sp.]